jgi:Fe-S-cluster-containing hydrogenase component 2
MRAITFESGQIKRDKERCFNCGLCTSQCIGDAFKGNLGYINFEGKRIPIRLRQSDRARAIRLAEKLKLLILDGSFRMTQMVDHL